MKSILVKITVLLVLFCSLACLYAFSPVHAPVVFQLTEKPLESAAERYLMQDCVLAKDRKGIIQELRKDARNSERYFVAMIEKGPSPEIVEANRKVFTELAEYQQKRREQRKSIQFKMVSKDQTSLRPLRNESTDSYVKRRLENMQLDLAQYAMEGLLELKSSSAKNYLEKLAKQKTPTGELARETLED